MERVTSMPPQPKCSKGQARRRRRRQPARRGSFVAIAAWADERFGPHKRWTDLPLAAPVREHPAV